MTDGWEPSERYLIVGEGWDRRRHACQIRGYSTLKEAQTVLAYGRLLISRPPKMRIVKATTTYEDVPEES